MKTLRAVMCVAVCLVALACAGCANYWQNRANDLQDVAKVSIGLGWALGVDVQATDFIHPSLGLGIGGFFMGHENRHISGAWTHMAMCFPVATALANVADTKLPEAKGVTSVQMIVAHETMWLEATRYMAWKEYAVFREGSKMGKETNVSWVRRMGFEATVSALLISARAGINPAELLDFVLGFTTLDIASDDKPSKPKEP